MIDGGGILELLLLAAAAFVQPPWRDFRAARNESPDQKAQHQFEKYLSTAS
jgi:hypothetical protein